MPKRLETPNRSNRLVSIFKPTHIIPTLVDGYTLWGIQLRGTPVVIISKPACAYLLEIFEHHIKLKHGGKIPVGLTASSVISNGLGRIIEPVASCLDHRPRIIPTLAQGSGIPTLGLRYIFPVVAPPKCSSDVGPEIFLSNFQISKRGILIMIVGEKDDAPPRGPYHRPCIQIPALQKE